MAPCAPTVANGDLQELSIFSPTLEIDAWGGGSSGGPSSAGRHGEGPYSGDACTTSAQSSRGTAFRVA